MTLWQSNRFGRSDHSRPTGNTVAAECEHRRISKKKHLRERKQKPVTLAPVGKVVPSKKIVIPFPSGTHVKTLNGILRIFYIAHFENKLAGMCRHTTELLALGLISEHPLHPESREHYQITKLGVDYFNQLCTRDKCGDNDLPSNMGERTIK